MYVRLCEGSVKNHVSDVCMHVSVPIFVAFIVHVCCSLAFQCILCVSAVCAVCLMCFLIMRCYVCHTQKAFKANPEMSSH